MGTRTVALYGLPGVGSGLGVAVGVALGIDLMRSGSMITKISVGSAVGEGDGVKVGVGSGVIVGGIAVDDGLAVTRGAKVSGLPDASLVRIRLDVSLRKSSALTVDRPSGERVAGCECPAVSVSPSRSTPSAESERMISSRMPTRPMPSGKRLPDMDALLAPFLINPPAYPTARVASSTLASRTRFVILGK